MDSMIKNDVDHADESDTVLKAENFVFKCENCSDDFENANKLELHHNKWHIPVSCPDCPKILIGRKRLTDHRDNHRMSKCPQCQKIFQRKYRKYHKVRCDKRVQKIPKPKKKQRFNFKCEFCKFAALSQKKLGVHLGKHIEKPKILHECGHCGYQSNRISNVKQHRIACAAKSETIIWF